MSKELIPLKHSHPELNEALTNRQWLIIMVGIPGSGKTSFARPLTEMLGAYRLNMDLLRKEIFGTANRHQQRMYDQMQSLGLNPADKRQYYKEQRQKDGQAFWQKLEMHLSDGRSVVVDSSSDRRSRRDKLRTLAEQHGVPAIVVWMQTPYPVAIERATHRALTSDSYPFGEAYLAREEIDRCLGNLDYPAVEENLVIINGQDSFAEQLDSFASYATQQFS